MAHSQSWRAKTADPSTSLRFAQDDTLLRFALEVCFARMMSSVSSWRWRFAQHYGHAVSLWDRASLGIMGVVSAIEGWRGTGEIQGFFDFAALSSE
jgi:hypothetical protein